MRLWSLDPHYLDSAGLVALWREGLMALHVLQGKTMGYRHHPQLLRFRDNPDPVNSILRYLDHVWREADTRGFHFDKTKLCALNQNRRPPPALWVTSGQLLFEWNHLLKKLQKRSPIQRRLWREVRAPNAHPIFKVIPGDRASWEKTK